MQNQNDLVSFDRLKADVTMFAAPAMEIQVTDQDSADKAILVGKQVKFWSKKVEEKRKELVKPLKDEAARIDSYAKDIMAPLLKAEAHIKAHLGKWSDHLEVKRREELKKAEEERNRLAKEAAARLEAQKKQANLEDLFKSKEESKREEVVAQVESERIQADIHSQHKQQVKEINSQKVSGARQIWTFEIMQKDQVPYSYWEIDEEKKIREAVNAGEREIAGVRIFQKTSIALR